jgi:uncharacterized membrane protein (UPF0127 family)
MAARLIAINVTRNARLTECGRIADSFRTRLVGLLRDKMLAQGDGLWIKPCNSIHSIGMKFVFDAVFLDKNLRVVHLMPEMKPWQMSKMVWAAKSVLELPAGRIAQTSTEVGDQFEMERIDLTIIGQERSVQHQAGWHVIHNGRRLFSLESTQPHPPFYCFKVIDIDCTPEQIMEALNSSRREPRPGFVYKNRQDKTLVEDRFLFGGYKDGVASLRDYRPFAS